MTIPKYKVGDIIVNTWNDQFLIKKIDEHCYHCVVINDRYKPFTNLIELMNSLKKINEL